jgi:hypothetical protein
VFEVLIAAAGSLDLPLDLKSSKQLFSMDFSFISGK